MSPSIPPEKISEIQRTLNILDIVSDYITLKQRGRNFIGLCPFHHEKTPSFTINIEKQIYKCFGCGEGGTVFNFLMKQEGLSFPEAVKALARKANVNIDDFSTREKHQGTSLLYDANEKASRFYNEILLKTKEAKHTRDYLLNRSINEESIRKFRLGYSPNRWDSVSNKAEDWNLNTQTLENAGLIQKRQEHGFYDRFRGRLMFPIIDMQNRPVGFGARALDNTQPKYLNSPETPIFNKSKTLYGINLAKDSAMKKRRVLLMEGYTDVIMAHQCGFDWSIAILGTALTREHVRLLRRYCDRAILVLDPDTAGQKSSERNLDIFIEEDLDVSVVLLPENYDPFDFLVKRGAQKFAEQVDRAYDFFSFKIKLSESKWDMSSVSGEASAIDDILLTAIKIPNVLKRELTIKRISEEMSIDERKLREHLTGILKKISPGKNRLNDNRPDIRKIVKLDPDKRVETTILSIMLDKNDLIRKVDSDIGFDSFNNKEFKDIATKMFEIYSQKGHVDFSDISPMLNTTEISGDLVDIISQQGLDSEKALNDCIRFIKKRKIKEGRKQARKKYALSKAKDSIQEVDKLLNKFHNESMDFHSIKKSR